MNQTQHQKLLRQFRRGSIRAAEVLTRLQGTETEDIHLAHIDHGRTSRLPRKPSRRRRSWGIGLSSFMTSVSPGFTGFLPKPRGSARLPSSLLLQEWRGICRKQNRQDAEQGLTSLIRMEALFTG